MIYIWRRSKMAYERILQRIAFIENQLKLLENWAPENREDFLGDLKLQAAIERNMQNIIEAIIQICTQLVKYFNLGPPTSEDSILELLEQKLDNYNLIKEFKKFRNFLVHQYLKVDSKKVYNYLEHFHEDVVLIIKEFRKIIS
ncbi:MAG: DUF86 domain-containing protein [Candidatus Lokiarchaeota archaeon]|nr:DUF86 domain-containing protein [Candidatus Lokiarchaeota archaeon]MBD3198524.1 DUF86 domain-containing protein [Candidatus Lokiarchaeota archaeon]